MIGKVLCILVAVSLLMPCFSCYGTNNYTNSSSNSPVITDGSLSSISALTTGPDTISTKPTYTTENPVSSSFVLSKAPKLGGTAELTFEIDDIRQFREDQPQEGLANAKAWVDFYWTDIHGSYTEARSSTQIPLEEVLVSGETIWKGNFNQSKVNLHSTIQLPREGIWHIRGNFTGEGWKKDYNFNYWVAVADGTAAIMNVNTEEFKAGPLGYLDTFPDGGSGYLSVPTQTNPFTIGLDIAKAPKAGEEVTLSCRILSVIEMNDFSIQWRFYKRTGYSSEKIPSTELLSSANLDWKTDIKKGEPVIFSTTIKFPTEGEWEILADGNYAENDNKYGTQDYIKISITSAKSYFGWMELPSPPASGTTSTLMSTPTPTSK